MIKKKDKMATRIPEFKSTEENFNDEYSGIIKNYTVRIHNKKEPFDERFSILMKWYMKGIYGRIRIVNKKDKTKRIVKRIVHMVYMPINEQYDLWCLTWESKQMKELKTLFIDAIVPVVRVMNINVQKLK